MQKVFEKSNLLFQNTVYYLYIEYNTTFKYYRIVNAYILLFIETESEGSCDPSTLYGNN